MEPPTPEEVYDLCCRLKREAKYLRIGAVNEYFADVSAKPLERAAELLEWYADQAQLKSSQYNMTYYQPLG